MRHPNFNPPNDDCPECASASRTYSLGSRFVADPTAPGGLGWTEQEWTCEHRHTWVIRSAAG
jgi:hypothetical protein